MKRQIRKSEDCISFINQQFLIEEFPEAVLINREDDLGLEGLRKAKLSYNPIDYARKYQVEQIW